MKLTLGGNFINVLRTAFTNVAPKRVRIQSSCQYLFMLLGSTVAKAARRTLMKLTHGRYVTQFCNLIFEFAWQPPITFHSCCGYQASAKKQTTNFPKICYGKLFISFTCANRISKFFQVDDFKSQNFSRGQQKHHFNIPFML